MEPGTEIVSRAGLEIETEVSTEIDVISNREDDTSVETAFMLLIDKETTSLGTVSIVALFEATITVASLIENEASDIELELVTVMDTVLSLVVIQYLHILMYFQTEKVILVLLHKRTHLALGF